MTDSPCGMLRNMTRIALHLVVPSSENAVVQEAISHFEALLGGNKNSMCAHSPEGQDHLFIIMEGCQRQTP
eukprot:1294864-Heterocapsa_arctica.AAC.1